MSLICQLILHLSTFYSQGSVFKYGLKNKHHRAIQGQYKTMAALRTILSLMLFRALSWAGEPCTTGVYPESGFALLDHVYKSFHVHHLVSCFMSCTAEPACKSLNYNPVDYNCELNNDTKYFRPKYFVKRPAFTYAENPYCGKLQCKCFLFTQCASICNTFLCNWFLLLVNLILSLL